METDEPLCQLGICHHCDPDVPQQLLFATNDYSGPIIEKGRVVGYEYWETISLFRCEHCKGTLLYTTAPEEPEPIGIDALDYFDPEEVAKLTTTQFLALSTLVWPKKKEPATLPASVPENIRRIYEGALKVKALDPDSFSVRVRRAIQAICIDSGAKEYDQDGRRMDLLDNLKELDQKRIFPTQVTDVFHQFRYLGNLGAHSPDETIKPEVAEVADELFRLIIQYIYEIPHKLDSLKQETQTLQLKAKGKPNQRR